MNLSHTPLSIDHNNFDTIPLYAALRRGSKKFGKVTSFSFTLEPEPQGQCYPYVRMSQIGMCGRKHAAEVYKDLRVLSDPYITIHQTRNLHVGKILEEYITEVLILGGIPVTDKQLELRDPEYTNIRGHIDGIITYNKCEYLLEVKVLNYNSSSRVTAYGVQKAIPYYYDQMQMYLQTLRTMERYENIAAAYFVVFVKDTGQFYVEFVPFNEERAAFLRRKALRILEVGNIFHLEEEFLYRSCGFCPLQLSCKEVDGEEVFTQKKLPD